MLEKSLFEKSLSFDDPVFRNIVSLRVSEDLFDDLTDGDEALGKVAQAAEMRVKNRDCPANWIDRSFHYSAAIEYPFSTDHFMMSRYSDGSFPVWYGSLDLETTVHETVYHMRKFEQAQRRQTRETIYRERAVYQVDLSAVLLDLRGKARRHKALLADDYSVTHAIGRTLSSQGHPGLVAASARCAGSNVVVFNKRVLSSPRVHCYLTYSLNGENFSVQVQRGSGETIMQL